MANFIGLKLVTDTQYKIILKFVLLWETKTSCSHKSLNMQIVIIGGGFAGINLAKELLNQDGIEVTLVDKNNYNFYC